MDWIRQLRFRLVALFRRKQFEAEMAEEMRSHLEFEAAARRAQGEPDGEARYAAQRAFGGVEQAKERAREQWSLLWLEQIMQDLRQALRSLRRNPGFTGTIVGTLALAIGANAIIFSLVNAVLLAPLPYTDADRLVSLRETRPLAGGTGRRVPVPVSPATFFDWRKGASAFEEIAAIGSNEVTFTGDGEPEQIPAAGVTSNLLPMMGVTPMLGRGFQGQENAAGQGPVALLSYDFWQRRFGGRESVVGEPITLEGQRVTVVGVLPASFDGPAAAGIARGLQPAVWYPLSLVEAGAPRSVPAYNVHARLRPGATIAGAQSELDAIMQRLAKEFPETNAARGALVETLSERVVGEVRSSVWVLFAAVGLVLLIACANVANLMLARAMLRGAETAMRAALGASRSRLVRQFLAESMLLTLTGCALGLGAVALSIDGFAALLPSHIPRVGPITIDGRVLAFTVGVSLLTGLGFGLLPAWQGAKVDLQAAIKTAGRAGHGGPGGARLRNALVVAQVALSVVLLAGAGLLLQSFVALTGVDPGFDPRNVLTLRINLPGTQYRSPEQQRAFYDQLTRDTRALPGVASAALVFPLPFSAPINNVPVSIPGRPVDRGAELAVECNLASADYFRTLRIRVTQGRAFTAADRGDSPPVAMVNETFARRMWPGENPLGKRVAIGRGRAVEREVVGVFADIKQRQLDSEPLLQACLPFLQQPNRMMYLAVRGETATPGLAAIRERIAALDRNVPHTDLSPWTARVAASVAPRRVLVWLTAAFAGAALLLAVMGLYGVMSYLVTQRTREFGIRTALGAQWRDLRRLVLGRGLRLVMVGVAIGLGATVMLSRVVATLTYGVSPTDPATLASVAFILGVAAAAACWLPARRAAHIDPIIALRSE